MPYAAGITEFVERCDRAMPPDFYTRPLEEQRRLYHGLLAEFPYDRPATVDVEDVRLVHDGQPCAVRVYRPRARRGDGAVMYIRGGGFVVGSLDTHDSVAAELAEKSGLVSIALDFRLAPEHPFPAAVEDCYGAAAAVAGAAGRLGIDPERLVLAGDSSGANLAVAVCLMCRDRGGPSLRGQALISPVLDFTRWQQGGDDAPLLTAGEMEYYTRCYAPNPATVAHPHVSPLVSGDLHGLPAAYVMAAEMDSLRVDALEYADRLRAHGIEVELVVEPGLVHSAVRARALSPQVADAWERFCAAAAALAEPRSVSS